ncbi:amino acid adenylation domain-containing protein, partial [Lysobacter brunescens]
MNALELYKLCRQAGVELAVDGENLRVTTSEGRIPESIKALLREHKQAMIELLAADRAPDGPVPAGAGGRTVLSYAQLRLWFQQMYDEQSAVYNIPLVLESDARLDEDRLRRSLRWLIERHEPLRTTIRNRNGVAEAGLLDPSIFEIAVHHDDGREDGIAADLIRQQTHRAFDLANDFMLRADLLQCDGQGSQLFITIHHVAADGWSLDIFVDELNRAYEAACEGQAPAAEPLPIRFSDYAAWQSDRLQGTQLDAQLAYWTRRLAHAPEIHQFPTDKPRPASPEFRGDRHRFELDEPTSRRLQSLARDRGCTLFALLQAAYAVFVARYSDTRDVVFGTPVANRTQHEVAGLIGFFANVVPMRTTLSEGQSFADLLSQVHADTVADISRHEIPLEMLIDSLKISRNASYNPLFQMMFSYEDATATAGGTGGARRTLRRSGRERRGTGSKFDLTLIARNTSDGLSFAWEYSHDLFDASSVRRFAANFLRLLRSIAADPQRCVDDLELLSDEEKAFFDTVGTGPRVDVEHIGAHRLFERWAERTPEATAVVHGDMRLSYRELDERANRLAWALIGQGVRKGDIVGLCLRHASGFPVAVLGVLKAGAAYLPMDPDYPTQRIAHIVRDSGAVLWLSDETAELLAPHDARTLDVARAISSGDDAQRLPPSVEVSGDDLAYVIYTSGSTGLPKGTMLEHKGAVSIVQAQRDQFDVQAEGDARSFVLQFSSISFDAATWEWLMSLCNGACLVVPDAESRRDPAAMARLVARHGVTHALFPPVYLAEFDDGDLSSIRHLIAGGEAVRQSEAARWSRGRAFHNAYGPTETTICSTIGRYLGGRIHIGRPISNHRCAVLDRNGRRVPVGALGELHIGGIGLARGYLNNPELTQARFVHMGVDGGTPERWYRSGDLVRWLADGNLEYVGRTDNQVKIRGFRVELGEIESMLVSHPAIAAGVACLPSTAASTAEQPLTVYYTFTDPVASVDRISLRQFLDQRLPEYMVPAAYVPLDAIPMTIHGKVDVARLPAPTEADFARRDYVPPVTDLQRLICSVLEDLLSSTRVGIRDNFFELGGDSILSIRAVARINALGHNLTSRQFFDARTVEAIADLLESGAGERVAFPQSPSEGTLELLPIQRRFFDLQAGFESRYLQSALLFVPEFADEAFFAAFVSAIVQRHDMLRARFAVEGDGTANAFFASTETDAMTALHVEDMTGMDAEARDHFLQSRGEAHKSAIDIEDGRLFAFVFFKAETAADSRLLVIFHHLIIDGVSWRILLDDLKLAFDQHRAGQRIVLPQKGTGYQQWSRMINAWGRDGGEEAAGTASATCECLLAVADATPAEVGDTLADTATVQAVLDPSETRILLQDCHKAYRTQINDLLLAALALALDRWQGIVSPDVFMESHGRDEDLFDGVDLSHCLGWFTSLYPIRLPACAGPETPEQTAILGAKDALRRVRHMGLSYLASGRHRDAMGIVFNYLGQFDQQLGSASQFGRASEATGHDVDRRRRREHLIGFNGRIADGRLVFGIDFNRHLFHPERIASLASHFESALRDLLAHCTSRTRAWASPSDFPLCDVSRRDLDLWQHEFGEIEDLYPASGNQLGMLYHAQLDGHSSYAPQNLLHFPEDFDPGAFKRAWSALIARHAVLRTVFVGPDLEQGLQLVLPHHEPQWIEHDISSLSPEAQDARIADHLVQDKRTPFDSRRAPLTRYTLFKRDGGRHLFVWTCSHAILDGWSLGIVYEELFALYDACREGREASLPSAPSYASYIRWTMGRNADDARDFWSQEMEGAAPRERIGLESPALPQGTGKSAIKRALPAGDLEAMKRFAARHRITVNTLVQAAWAYWLARSGDTDTIVTGITLSGRPADLPGVEAMVGLMVNTVPAAIRIPREQTVVAWLQALHEQHAKREQYGFMPLSEIVKLKTLDEGQSIFNTVLGFHSQPVERAAGEMQKRGTKGGVGHDETHYPLVLGVSPHAGLHLTLTYDASLFERSAMERMCDQVGRILRSMVAEDDRLVADLDMLGEDERAALVALSEGPAPERAAVLLPALFRANAQ